MVPVNYINSGKRINLDTARIAIVHDWFVGFAGGEQVAKVLMEMFPQATLVTAVARPSLVKKIFPNRKLRTSMIQKMPFSYRKHQIYIPFMPVAYESLNLKEYDLIISSGAFSKSIITHPGQIHINYNHTPIRYAWGFGGDTRGQGILKRKVCHYLRQWDYVSAQRPDHIIANSKEVKGRIAKVYRRDATVIYPPVDLNKFGEVDRENIQPNEYITFGRLVDYKRVGILVQAFKSMPDKILHIVGEGPDRTRLEKQAQGHANIVFHGRISDEKLISLLGKVQAFVFAAEEDFGIAPIEAMGAGVPVIAYGAGGALEYVQPGVNGYIFKEQNAESLIESIKIMSSWDPIKIKGSVHNFSRDNFEKNIRGFLDNLSK